MGSLSYNRFSYGRASYHHVTYVFKAIQDEVREFVKNDVLSKLVRDMNQSIIKTGRPFIEIATKKKSISFQKRMCFVHESKI